uniref:Uncharacterized protein n=1 Tax=Cacopsylla melanoneura TaxID=428564 RepID=A0A8D8ZMC6_9HEMI
MIIPTLTRAGIVILRSIQVGIRRRNCTTRVGLKITSTIQRKVNEITSSIVLLVTLVTNLVNIGVTMVTTNPKANQSRRHGLHLYLVAIRSFPRDLCRFLAANQNTVLQQNRRRVGKN